MAEASAPTRAGVRAALAAAGFDVCAEAAHADEAVRAAVRERPDVCLLDVQMPGGGIAAAAEIAASVPGTAIVMFTSDADDDDLFDALRVGAVGYLLKETSAARLPDALRGVLQGEAAIPRVLVARLVEEFRERRRRRRLPVAGRRGVELTSREAEVLDLMRQGLTTTEIARRLFVAPVTVRTHVASILRKLDAPDRKTALSRLDPLSNLNGD